MLLAHTLWERTPRGEAATEETWANAYERSLALVHDELRAIWGALSTGQRRVLTTIAENTAALYAGGRGGSRGGAIATAVRALEDRGEITKDSHRLTGYRLIDPLLATWVAAGRPGA
jgi:hypothetical protein